MTNDNFPYIHIDGNIIGTAPDKINLEIQNKLLDVIYHQIKLMEKIQEALKPGDIETGMHIETHIHNTTDSNDAE